MSGKCVSWVLENQPESSRSEAVQRTDLLVLVVYADHARDDGTGAYPSIDTVARKARLKRRSAEAAVRRLREDERLVRTGTMRTGTVIYRMPMTAVEATPHPHADPSPGAPHPAPPDGAPPSPQTGEPSYNRPTPTPSGTGTETEKEVFAHWQAAFDCEHLPLTSGRRKYFTERLASFSAQEVKDAITAAAASKWWHEPNEMTEDRLPRYEPWTLLKNDAKVRELLAPAVKARRKAAREAAERTRKRAASEAALAQAVADVDREQAAREEERRRWEAEHPEEAAAQAAAREAQTRDMFRRFALKYWQELVTAAERAGHRPPTPDEALAIGQRDKPHLGEAWEKLCAEKRAELEATVDVEGREHATRNVGGVALSPGEAA